MTEDSGERLPATGTGASDRGNSRIAAVRIGPWEVVDAEGGGSVAVDARRLAVASQAHLAVWLDGQRLATADAPWPAPGKPRFAQDRVFWGPGVLDLRSGQYSVLVTPGPATWPGGSERPQVHAWSARGERLLVSYSTGDPARPTRVDLLEGADGRAIATRWSANALAPEAAWAGRDVAVVGFRDLEVLDATSGAVRGHVRLEAGSVISLDADAGERCLVAVDLNRAVFWVDLHELRIVDRWAGQWQDAAITPDGLLAVALDLAGRLHFADLGSRRFRPIGAADNVTVPGSVALGQDVLAVAGGGVAARAGLTFQR
jgi:hypothetical protein